MKYNTFLIQIFFIFFLISCKQAGTQEINNDDTKVIEVINNNGAMLRERINPPKGYQRLPAPENSFGEYLRNLPMKPHNSKVLLYNGKVKLRNVHMAVIDLPIGHKNLHHCADAVIRLRAEYLYSLNNYNAIHFNLTNGFRTDYTKWMEGYRIKVDGNRTWWVKTTESSSTYESFWKYLKFVFTYAGTYSLEQETEKVDYVSMQPGDILIQGGFPGHAVIVVDMAENSKGEKVFLLAQSYMPAQELHILKNSNENKISPWYKLDKSTKEIRTPEWVFYPENLKRFGEAY